MSPAFSPPPSLSLCSSPSPLSLSHCLPLSPCLSPIPPSLHLSFSLCTRLAHSNGPRPGTLGAQEIRWELGVCVYLCVSVCVCVIERVLMFICASTCVYERIWVCIVCVCVCVCFLVNVFFFFFPFTSGIFVRLDWARWVFISVTS